MSAMTDVGSACKLQPALPVEGWSIVSHHYDVFKVCQTVKVKPQTWNRD